MDQGNYLKKVPFILVTGFLGSGKTSLLSDMIDRYADHFRIAIVQNEFAPGHIDGFTLKQSGKPFELMEINNGSVFCACLLGDFITRLGPFIHETAPDLILLEATGLADPVSLGQVLQAPELTERIFLAGSWCLVDAVNFEKVIRSVSRARHQLRIADIVWLNKTDLVTDTTGIRSAISKLNPFARIIETSHGSTHSLAFQLPFHADPPSASFHSSGPDAGRGYPVSEDRPGLGSCVVRSNRYFNENNIRAFIHRQSAQLHRIKGYIRMDESVTMAIQTVFADVSIVFISDYEGPSELIAIGPGLNNREFSKELLSLQKK